MPGFFHQPISRKTFLKTSGLIAAGLLAPRRAIATESADVARIALLSDTHIPADAAGEYRGFRPVDNLRQIVPQILASQPQAAIINGDAARLTGEHDDYVALRKLLQPVAADTPIHIALGNHDDRNNFFKVFPDAQAAAPVVPEKHVTIFRAGGVQFVVLDSLLYVDRVAGLLGKKQRQWLAKFLTEADDTPVVLFVHHTLGDDDGDLLDFHRIFPILQSHRKVKAIIYGHSHRYAVEQREHIYLINQPAVGYNFADDQPVGWLESQFCASKVEMKLHTVGGNQADNGTTTVVDWA